MTRINITVQKRPGLKGWWVRVGGLELPRPTQHTAHMHAKTLAHEHECGGGHCEVILHRKDGSIGPRDTYPRSSDPRKSKG